MSDLQPTIVNGPGTAITGGSVTVSWTVTNNGPAATNANCVERRRLDVHEHHAGQRRHGHSTSAPCSTTTPWLRNDSYGDGRHLHAAGGHASGQLLLSSSLSIGPLLPPGVDAGSNLVYETNETNNELAAELDHDGIRRRDARPRRLQRDGAEPRPRPGQQLAVSWKVTNTGGGHGQRCRSPTAVYLSYDRVSTRRIATWARSTHQGGLADGGQLHAERESDAAGRPGRDVLRVRGDEQQPRASTSRIRPTTRVTLRRRCRFSCRPGRLWRRGRSRSAAARAGGPEHHHHLPGDQHRRPRRRTAPGPMRCTCRRRRPGAATTRCWASCPRPRIWRRTTTTREP